jgi:hypothetical protein
MNLRTLVQVAASIARQDSALGPFCTHLALPFLMLAIHVFGQSKSIPHPVVASASSMTTKSGYKLEIIAVTYTDSQPKERLNAALGGQTLTFLNDYAINDNQDLALVGLAGGTDINNGFLFANNKVTKVGSTVDGMTIKKFGYKLRLNNRGSVAYSALAARESCANCGVQQSIFLNDKLIFQSGMKIDGRRIDAIDGAEQEPTFLLSDQDDVLALVSGPGKPFMVKNDKVLDVETHGENIISVGMNSSGEVYYALQGLHKMWTVCKIGGACSQIELPGGTTGRMMISNTGVVVHRGMMNPGLPQPTSMTSKGIGVQPWAGGPLVFDVSKWNVQHPTAGAIIIDDSAGSRAPMINDLGQVLYLSTSVKGTFQHAPLGTMPTDTLKLATPPNVKPVHQERAGQ